MPEDMRIFLGIGSNVNDRYQNLKMGMRLINDHPHIWIIEKSYIYQSKAMYYPEQDDFYNMVIEIETNLNPIQLLDSVKTIERKTGRNTNNSHNMPRTLDLDILSMGDILIRTNVLEIPHPKIAERKFVLKPWNDIAPTYVVPILNKDISGLLKITKDTSPIDRVLIIEGGQTE